MAYSFTIESVEKVMEDGVECSYLATVRCQKDGGMACTRTVELSSGRFASMPASDEEIKAAVIDVCNEPEGGFGLDKTPSVKESMQAHCDEMMKAVEVTKEEVAGLAGKGLIF